MTALYIVVRVGYRESIPFPAIFSVLMLRIGRVNRSRTVAFGV